MTRGTLSTVVSPRSDPVRASGRPMVVTLRKSCSSEVRDSTLVVIRMKRRKMEVVVRIRFLVEDRGLNSIVRNAQVDIEKQ